MIILFKIYKKLRFPSQILLHVLSYLPFFSCKVLVRLRNCAAPRYDFVIGKTKGKRAVTPFLGPYKVIASIPEPHRAIIIGGTRFSPYCDDRGREKNGHDTDDEKRADMDIGPQFLVVPGPEKNHTNFFSLDFGGLQRLCSDSWRPSRMEAECIRGDGLTFYFPQPDCNLFHGLRATVGRCRKCVSFADILWSSVHNISLRC